MIPIRHLATAGLSLLTASLVGCASIVSGGPGKLSVRSQPDGARVTIFDKKGREVAVGTTPTVFPLRRGAGYFTPARYRVVIEKPGYTAVEVPVKGTFNGMYAGNLLFGGLIGLIIVDPLTGAMWTLSPKDVDQVLAAGQTSYSPARGEMLVVLRQDLPAGLEDRLVPLPADGLYQ